MKAVCPRCGYNYELEEGYWVGAMTVNIIATELLFAVLLIIAIIYYWPELPVIPLIVAGVAINGLFPVVFYPISKTLWVAIDLSFFNRISADGVWS